MNKLSNVQLSTLWPGKDEVLKQLKNLLRFLTEKPRFSMHEKDITAVCRTSVGIEWTTWNIKSEGAELIRQDAAEVRLSGETTEEIYSSIELPETVTEDLTGDITVPLRTSELLMRVMEIPSTDDAEISSMVGFQVNKISPFPQEQLAVSHEVLRQTEDKSLVLMAAAKRSCIDAVGDTFEEKGVRVHGIDARVLGWMKLLEDGGHVQSEGCMVLIIDDAVDSSLIVMAEGSPAAFRMLDRNVADIREVEEIVEEIGYTLATLETEHELKAPSAVHLWGYEEPAAETIEKLSEKTAVPFYYHHLSELPPLSEGITRRTMSGQRHIELVPREWIEHERRMLLRRQFAFISTVTVAVWLAFLLVFYSFYKVRTIRLNRIEKRLAAIEPAARQALENRQKLKTLTVYTDRSDSALECLREVTDLLPPGNIEFASYNYKKGKGVSLRGSAGNDETVYDFFDALTDSDLFSELKDQSVNSKVIKGVRTAVFSVSLDLPGEEEQ